MATVQQAPPGRRPRWGHRTSLWQWRQPAFYLYLVIMVFSGYVMLAQQQLFANLAPQGFALSWVLMLIYAVPMFLLIYFLDLYEREPLSLVFGALLWGGFAATLLSILGNTGWGLALGQAMDPATASEWMPALTAPWVEEIHKALGIVLIYLIARGEIDDIMDGFVYGAMVGLGFTVIEDIFYFIGHFGGTTEGVLQGFFLRVIASGLYGHVLYSGLAGMGIAYFTTHRGEFPFGRRMLGAVALFLVAMFAHFLWNSPLLDFFPTEEGKYLQVMGATAVKGMPFLIFVFIMVKLAHTREHRWLAAALESEVGKGGIDRAELEALDHPRDRRAARRAMRARAGTGAAALMKKLQREQMNLAMVSTRVPDDHPDLLQQREYCRRIREALHGMPGAAPPA